jgi:hypothetical protein
MVTLMRECAGVPGRVSGEHRRQAGWSPGYDASREAHMCVTAERQLIAERMLARAEAAGNKRGVERARMSIDTAQRQHRLRSRRRSPGRGVHGTTPKHGGELAVASAD